MLPLTLKETHGNAIDHVGAEEFVNRAKKRLKCRDSENVARAIPHDVLERPKFGRYARKDHRDYIHIKCDQELSEEQAGDDCVESPSCEIAGIRR